MDRDEQTIRELNATWIDGVNAADLDAHNLAPVLGCGWPLQHTRHDRPRRSSCLMESD